MTKERLAALEHVIHGDRQMPATAVELELLTELKRARTNEEALAIAYKTDMNSLHSDLNVLRAERDRAEADLDEVLAENSALRIVEDHTKCNIVLKERDELREALEHASSRDHRASPSLCDGCKRVATALVPKRAPLDSPAPIHGEPPNIYYVHANSAGSIFVKTKEFFEQQGGLMEPWGKAWQPIEAASLADARGEYADRKYQEFLDRNARTVDAWPSWKKGDPDGT